MRSEQDAIGEVLLSEKEYFGIGTARLCTLIKPFGPCIPERLIVNVVRVRQAQAQMLGLTGVWSELLADSVVAAGEKLAALGIGESEQVVVRAMHGGGARCLVSNVDEVLANIALEMQNHPKGEYHRMAPLFQLDNGFGHQTAFLIAFHISIVQEIDLMLPPLQQCINIMKQQEEKFRSQKTLTGQNFQAVKISDVGAEFGCCAASLVRTLQMLKWHRAELLRIKCDSRQLAEQLSLHVGIDLVQDLERNEFPLCLDLYGGTSSLLKTAAMSLLQLCSSLRFLTGVTKELEAPRYCAGYAFNPSTPEMLIPDTVSQIAFQIVGNDASFDAAINSGSNGVSLYLPMVSTLLLGSAQLLTTALSLLGQDYLSEIHGNANVSARLLETTPLQAEKLIPILGYERAVQVARIAALTEKPVRMVVARMKLLTEEQAEILFAEHTNETEENE